jgi:hypothetical protein
LADGRDVGSAPLPEVVEERLYLLGGFTQADHQTGLGQRLRLVLFGELEDVERLPIIGLRPHAAIQAGDCLHVVVVDVGSGIEHPGHGLGIAVEVGSEDFHAS